MVHPECNSFKYYAIIDEIDYPIIVLDHYYSFVIVENTNSHSKSQSKPFLVTA